ncbi:hypothetical protein [Paenibacillus nasutitermitis]|uniref:L-fucose isomerase C-terminal domain-containing protein n=1 Tax=Paenibacillus nasutitermitis TaxID=1652958 RepID=A0A917DP49_9BACL|nr:hypothetical protein [Paenibacillus nasutitermitis]GGD52952.1 hypothetical protein GCM10010911_08170 [Paenibacillus nasutitermitis]
MGQAENNKPVLGVIVGNRDFFPDHLAASGRATILKVLEAEGIEVIIVGETQTKNGTIETHDEANIYQQLLIYICEQGFEHHVAVNLNNVSDSVKEAFSKYLGRKVYHHAG